MTYESQICDSRIQAAVFTRRAVRSQAVWFKYSLRMSGWRGAFLEVLRLGSEHINQDRLIFFSARARQLENRPVQVHSLIAPVTGCLRTTNRRRVPMQLDSLPRFGYIRCVAWNQNGKATL